VLHLNLFRLGLLLIIIEVGKWICGCKVEWLPLRLLHSRRVDFGTFLQREDIAILLEHLQGALHRVHVAVLQCQLALPFATIAWREAWLPFLPLLHRRPGVLLLPPLGIGCPRPRLLATSFASFASLACGRSIGAIGAIGFTVSSLSARPALQI